MTSQHTARNDATLRAISDLMRGGRLAEARVASEAALAEGDRSEALLGLAAMLAAQGNDPAAAAGHLEQLVALRPDDRAARINLAQALLALGRFERIEPLCAPLAGDPGVDRLVAFAVHQLGDLVRASTLYRQVLARLADDADSWANLGNVHDALGESDAAIAAFERAITLRPADVRFHLTLAGILERADRGAARRKVMRDAAAARPEDPDVQLALGLAEAAMEDTAAAEAALRRSLAVAPERSDARLELGLLLENNNRIDDLEALIATGPQGLPELALLDAWVAFRRHRFDEARAIAASLPETLNPIRRFHLQGEAADRCGDAAAAFDAFARMNAASLAAAPVPRPGPSYRAKVVEAIDVQRAATPADRAVAMPDGVPTPVFIVGFPRSGTTLLDTILGRLPNTHVLEEQPLIPNIEQRIGAPERIAALDPKAIAAYRQDYLAGLRAIAPDAAGKRIIDKHPLHMARMPLLNALFPQARILFVERHPYDVVLSCFFSNFRLNQAMRSFTDIEEAARTYDAVLTAWSLARETLDLHVHAVRYERLVVSSEEEMRPALSFIGADYDPAILDTAAAAKMRGHVRTASYAQVAQPIYQRSVARWERYRDQLAPVRDILAPWATRFGYPC
ncbi:tetratricopeptide repeat-containing sulfotransferase family protein [Sphingomonas hylomeconis]|uniref:Sulfotransferase n=1 Tax=Sphingomonas hylomeconis TaxID=1395958 RepID=A0ABV7SW06_9SPHN|nr:tetratricopeptide repeat-containing sulfotransferase family protein [Sphingomonas hylomeconis]